MSRGRDSTPPFLHITTGKPYLDLGAAMVALAVKDLRDPAYGSDARAFLRESPIARMVIAILEAEGHDFNQLAAARSIRN